MEIAEDLCDDICMINKSRKVLDGRLREVRRSYGRNAVSLRIEGGDGILGDPTIVAEVKEKSEDLQVLLAPGIDPQTLLKRLVDSGAVVSKFELAETRLHDIFIDIVKEAA